MCLAIPGRVTAIYRENDMLMGKVDFGGVCKPVCLECLPEIVVGEYALVHVGVALTRLDETEAQRIFAFLETLGELGERDGPGDHEVP